MDSAAEPKNDMNIDFSDQEEEEEEELSSDSDRIRIPAFNENKGHKVILSSEEEDESTSRARKDNLEDISRSYDESQDVSSSGPM